MKESDLNQLSKFISKEYGDFKMDGRYNKGGVIIS
jgi:hypothetical protein